MGPGAADTYRGSCHIVHHTSLRLTPPSHSPSTAVSSQLGMICQQSGEQLFLLHCNFFDRNYSCQLPPTLASSTPQTIWAKGGRNQRNIVFIGIRSLKSVCSGVGGYGHMCRICCLFFFFFFSFIHSFGSLGQT